MEEKSELMAHVAHQVEFNTDQGLEQTMEQGGNRYDLDET